jgi:hypothetical protein
MLEVSMASIVIATALFLGGITVGVIALVAVSVRREDRAITIAGDAPDRISRSARRLNGLGRRGLDTGFLQQVRTVGELVH